MVIVATHSATKEAVIGMKRRENYIYQQLQVYTCTMILQHALHCGLITILFQFVDL